MSSITLSDIMSWWPLLTIVGGFVMTFLLYRFRGEFATKADLASLASSSADTGRRVERIEEVMKHQPSKEDFHQLQLGMERITGSLAVMRAESEGSRDLLSRVETALTRHEDILASASRNGDRK